jgi:hypothetical protein
MLASAFTPGISLIAPQETLTDDTVTELDLLSFSARWAHSDTLSEFGLGFGRRFKED